MVINRQVIPSPTFRVSLPASKAGLAGEERAWSINDRELCDKGFIIFVISLSSIVFLVSSKHVYAVEIRGINSYFKISDTTFDIPDSKHPRD